MKKIVIILFALVLIISGCSSDYENTLTLKNLASGTVYLNFRGEITSVPAGKTVILSKLPKGRYEYETTYSVPAGVTNSTAVGDVSGEMLFKAGTKVLILYSSTFSEDTYTIYATKTSNEDLDKKDNPLFP